MKQKRRRGTDVPPSVKSFIDSVIASPLEEIELHLRDFAWQFEKGDFHHWVDLFNKFDSFFDKYVNHRKDLNLERDEFLLYNNNTNPSFPRDPVLEILRVSRIILENCSNRHLYSSFEHFSCLLSCTDADIIEATLQTLMAFNNKSSGTKTPIVRTASLTSKLFSLSQGWGGKEGGLGLISCCLPTETGRPGSTLHFEFYSTRNGSNGLRTIHIPDVHLSPETDFELFVRLVRENEVPAGLRFALLTRLRFARAFGNLKDRYRFVCIRLYAFILLVQAGRDSEDVTAFFANEPEFIDELLSLLSYHEDVPEKVRIVSILALVALCQDRSHQPNVLSSISNTGHRTILPTILQKSIDSITPPTRSTKCSVIFTEALLSLLSILVSSTPGSLALQEAGIIPTILPLLKDTDPQHLHLVTTCAHVIEGLLDYHPPSSALFRDLGGLDESILRLKGEVFEVDNSGSSSTSTKPASSSSIISRKGKEVIDTSQVEPVYSDTVLLHNRRALMKGLLRVISLATYGPGTATRVTGSVETVLPHCLSAIFKKAKEFGGGVFSLSAHVLTDLIHKDPTCFPSLESAGLPSAFIDAITTGSGPLSSSDVVTCIPPCLDALCLNNNGLNLVKERNALRCFVKIFTSKSYLKALSGETAGSVSSGLDELLRHASVLRPLGVEMVIQILETVIKLGNLNLPMDTDESEKNEMGDNESFVPECISNIVRLLEPIVQNLDTCRMFIEKKGVEAVMKLFDLESVPVSVSIGHTVSAAFKNFSPTQSVSLVRTVRYSLREHLNTANKLLGSVSGSGLQDVVPVKLQPVLKSLSSLEGLLSLTNFLLKSNTVMIAELAVSEAEVLKELAKVYMEATWQASLLADCNKPDENLDNNMGEEEGASTGTSPSTSVERETDSTELIGSFPNPVTRTGIDIDIDADNDMRVDQDFASVVRSATNVHRHHGRMSSLARLRGGGRLIRHLEAFHSHADPERSNFTLETSIGADTGAKKDPNSLVPEVLSKLGSTIRLFLTVIVKSLPARRRTETVLSTAARTVLNGLSQLFLSALSYTGYSPPGADSSLSVKCRYLGKISDDISALTFDSRRRACYSSTVNGFYTNGTFKELLTTFEATSQLLWTLPKSPEYPSWLLETLQNYFKLLEYYVNSSYLLTTTAPQSTQLLVQPVTNDLSINLFPLPRDPKGFVSVLQTQVLEAVLPVWNHPMLPNCPQSIISPLICIVDHICSEIGDSKHAGGAPGGVNPRLGMVPPIDEQTVTTIVDMGFSRARAEEALRNVGANSVELATDWLFTHPEEIVQEDLQLAQALALSLGNNNSNDESDAAKEDSPGGDGNNNNNNVAVPVLPLDDILSVVAKLFRKKDELIVLALNDLLITLCNRNKGGDRNKVLAYLVQQLKLCPVGPGTDAGALYPIAHLLAFLLSEDSDTREVAAANGVVSVALGILNFFLSDQRTGVDASPEKEKAITALLLVLDSMLQPNKPVVNPETAPDPTPDPPEKENEVKKSVEDTFGEILGKPSGYLTEEESQRVMNIACELVKLQVPASVMQACLQLCARLTKIHSLSTRFIETGVLSVIFNLPNSCVFPGFDSLASVIVRHLVEDPQTLQSAMEVEIKQALNGSGFLSRHGGRVSTRSFLTSMAPVISRDPVIFMKAAANVCQLDPSSGGRMNVVLFKDNKEKDKDNKEKDRDNKDKGESTPGKCTRGHKKVPASLSHVMDRLLEIVLSYEPKIEESTGICQDGSLAIPMEIDEANNKGKSKVDDESEQPSVARVSLVLKLLSEILLMYSHTVLVLLKRDSEMMQMRGTCGVVHHVLHNLMPVSNKKISGVTSGDVSHIKLSEKASFFLVVLCSRSTEGRRRVISEIARAFLSFPMGLSGSAGTSSTSSGTSNWDNGAIVPDRRVWSLCYLVYVILSRSGSGNNMPGVGCSPDIARAMIEGGMVQSLSSLLKAIDLDHPDAPRVCNLILKSLESLTRAANLNEQVVKPDDSSKNRTTGSDHATGLSIHEPDSAGTDMAIAEEQEAERERPIESQEQDRVSDEDTGMDRGEDENPREESGLGLVGDEDEDDRDDDDEVDEDDDDEDDDDDDRDDGVGAVDHGAHMIPLADPDAIDDDEDDDEYNEDMIEEDEEDADVPANRFIEVRWQGGLSGLENLRVSRGRGFIEIASESFQGGGDETDELFNLHRSFGMERRRHPGASANSRSAAHERSAVSGFEHPLIARTAREQLQQQQQQQYIASREGAINPVTQFYMFTNGMQSEGGSGSLFSGDRLVGSSNAPSQSVDFSLGMESLRISGRRGGLGWDNRWTDDGQSQTSAVASAIALAVEDHFVSEIPTVPVQVNNASNPNPVPSDATVNNPIPSDTSNPNDQTTSRLVDVDVPMQPISSPPLLDPGIAVENNDQVLPDTELVAGDSNSNRDALMPDTDMIIGDSNSNMDALMSDMDSCHAVMSSNPPAPELSDAHVGTENEAEDVNNNNDENNESENPVQEQEQEPVPAEENEIDPTFLEALPEDLRAEVLASQQNRPSGEAAEVPAGGSSAADVAADAAEENEIDPEFLAALPPDIQAEVLAQQRAQRLAQSRQQARQPTDMDNASIIATFPPEIREEVLLTSSEAVLSGLPSELLAEAQLLRDRELSRYRSRGSLFGGSHQLHPRLVGGASRRFTIDGHHRPSGMDRGVGVSLVRRVAPAGTSSGKGKEVEGAPLFDRGALEALLRLFQLAQPLSKGILERLMLNLCAHSVTRKMLVSLLVDMIRLEAEGPNKSRVVGSCRLYGRKFNVVYAQPESPNGLPPLVSRRILEHLTYLASSHTSVADILSLSESSESDAKAVVGPAECKDTPLLLFLKLLKVPLFLRSRVHLEQVMLLLEVVVNNAVSKIDLPSESDNPSEQGTGDNPNPQPAEPVPEPAPAPEPAFSLDDPNPQPPEPLSKKESENISVILTGLPESELGNLCNVLALEGLPSKVYSLASEVVKKLASIASTHGKFFSSELATLARSLSSSAISELSSLRTNQNLGFSTMTGTAILRVLQALCTLSSESEQNPILFDLNSSLEPLWQELSECISLTESKIGQSQTSGGEAGASTSSQPLPPGTQRLLPFIESFFVLCEKLQSNPSIFQLENTTASPQRENVVTFARVAEKHRRLLNVFIRQNPSLLEKSLSMMLKVPRLIDFDNKRAYFRSRIRLQNDNHMSGPIRVSVRRAYILEDSYNQLRMRRHQDLKGRLTVQFQGEEGIDAGGLTREWYQLLSRVIFDKGTLLFTTVGNNVSFQPNPNSVYQTEHLSYFKFVGRVVAKALFDGQLLDVHFTRSFYKHILGVKVTYHDIEAVDPDYYKNLKWMLENDVSDIPDLTFSMDADEEKHILYEKNQVTDYELKPGGRNLRVTEETKHEYVDLVADHILTNAIRPQINAFLEGFNELIPTELISIFNDKELELLISGLPEIDLDDLRANAEYIGYTAASPVVQWFWEVVNGFSKEDMARLLQFVTGTSKVPLEGFKALQGISGAQRFQIHKAYGAPERLPSAHTCFNQLDLPDYNSKEQLEERLLLAIHEASEGFGFG